MKTICAWCNKSMGSIIFDENSEGLLSHGICKECFGAMKGPKKSTLKEFLDSIETPVLVVGLDATINYANMQAREILQKEMPNIEGIWGGDVFECAYAKLREGCGNTSHCVGCTIRNTVMDTMQTGNSHLRSPAYLMQGTPEDNQEIKFLISTEKVSDVVLLRIDKVGDH